MTQDSVNTYISAALVEIAEQLRRAEVQEGTFQVPSADSLASDADRRHYLATRLGAGWLSAPAGDGADAEWAQVLFEAIWSGDADAAGAPAAPWVRSAVAAYLAKEEFPDVFVPASGTFSSRGLSAFRLAQVGGILARCFGDQALVRCAAGVVGLEATMGEDIWTALGKLADGLQPGQGPDDPSWLAFEVYGGSAEMGRNLDAAVDVEVVMLTQALEYTCLEEQDGGGVRRDLPYAACTFDFEAFRLTAVTHERTVPRHASLPPDWCRSRTAVGETVFCAAVNGASRRDLFKLATQFVAPEWTPQ